MTIERQLITRAQPFILAARAQGLIQQEAIKGCAPAIYPIPVCLEPAFNPIMEINAVGEHRDGVPYIKESHPDPHSLRRLRVWISPEQGFSWVRSELFIKGLKSLPHRVGFEICGNQKNIEFYFLIRQDDLPQFASAFKSQFDRCELTTENLMTPFLQTITGRRGIEFLDYFPLPPYSHLFTQPEEIKVSPFNTIISALTGIEPPAIGFYQLLFQGVSPEHNWHQNINILNDFEYMIKLMSGSPTSARIPLQSPSGELRGMAMDTEKKAHNDKPFFAGAVRLGVIGNNNPEHYLPRLSVFANLFQHGGRALQSLSKENYRTVLTSRQIESMLLNGETYRPGFLLNSSELSAMVHMPPAEYLINEKAPTILLETLPAKGGTLLTGTPIGVCQYAGTDQIICIPQSIRSRSTHIVARQGMGKSTLLEHMILNDIISGAGVAVLDPHGDLIYRLLHLIPEPYAGKAIFLFPGDREWIPLWNPLQPVTNQDISRTADDLVASIKNIVQGWGDRLENLLRHSFYALLKVRGASLLDVSNLLRKKSPESKLLIEEIMKTIDNETSRIFWNHDFPNYSNQDLSPPQHKLSKLLMSGTVSLMLSQPESRFNFRNIMDHGQILLVDLSGLGFELRQLLGSFILSLLHISAVSRSDIPLKDRKPFHIYCDEAHRFLPATIGDLIPETRKFAVDLTLAHQYMRQFDNEARDAIMTAGSTIVFNVDLSDAHYLVKDFRGLARPEDLASFEVGEAVARIGTDIVKIRTQPPLVFPKDNFRQLIIDASHRNHCRPSSEVKEMLAARSGHSSGRFTAISRTVTDEDSGIEDGDFKYEEFD